MRRLGWIALVVLLAGCGSNGAPKSERLRRMVARSRAGGEVTSTTVAATSTTTLTQAGPTRAAAPDATPTTVVDPPGLLHGVVVDPNGNPVVGIAVYFSWGSALLRTDTEGRFQLTCASTATDPSPEDPIMINPWEPIFAGHSGPGPSSEHDPTSRAPTLGWTYAAPSGLFTGADIEAPRCYQLPDPLRVVLPVAGTLNLTVEDANGNILPATSVALFIPGLSPRGVEFMTRPDGGDSSLGDYYGKKSAEEMIIGALDSDGATGVAPRYWQNTTNSSGTTAFTSLSNTEGGYSLWVGNLLTTCSQVNVTAGSTTTATCRVIPAPTPATTTSSTAP